MLQKIIHYLKKPWVIAGIILVIILCIVIIKFSIKPVVAQVVQATKTTVQEEVSVTGKVTPASAVDLSFEKGGKVTVVNELVGDDVKAGETIVKLDSRDLAAQRAQAVATLDFQQAKLAELQNGTRPEEISLSESKVESAESDVALAQANLAAALQASFSSADDAIRGKIDEVFTNTQTPYPQFIFQLTQDQNVMVVTGRAEVGKRLVDLQTLTAQQATSTTIAMANYIKQDLAEIKLFLDNLSLVINTLPQNYFHSDQINVLQWRNDLSAARVEVNNAITTILTSESNLKQNQDNLISLQGQLTVQQSGTVSEEIQAQAAQVASAQASVASVDAQIAKLSIISPISGVVTKQDAKIGETVIPNTPIVSIINDGQFDIEANVAEADIAKVSLGQEADVTLDAYTADDAFKAVVVSIDPAETIVDGVPTYKVTFQFTQADNRIKSGMTANVDIIGNKRENVVAIPERAVITHDNKKYVTIQQGDKTVEVQVTTGLRGYDGLVEITSGLQAGQDVVIK